MVSLRVCFFGINALEKSATLNFFFTKNGPTKGNVFVLQLYGSAPPPGFEVCLRQAVCMEAEDGMCLQITLNISC